MRGPSQLHIAMHTLFGNKSKMEVDNGLVARFHQQTKTLKNTYEARPSIKNRITNVLKEV